MKTVAQIRAILVFSTSVTGFFLNVATYENWSQIWAILVFSKQHMKTVAQSWAILVFPTSVTDFLVNVATYENCCPNLSIPNVFHKCYTQIAAHNVGKHTQPLLVSHSFHTTSPIFAFGITRRERESGKGITRREWYKHAPSPRIFSSL